jgi:hypothetical protein
LAVQLASDRPNFLMRIAPLFVLAGKREEYREVCERLMDRWEEWTGDNLGCAAAMCYLNVRPASDPDRLLRLGQRAAEKGPDWSALQLPRLYIRIGDYERAKSMTIGPTAIDRAILEHMLGHHADARALLKYAAQRRSSLESPYASPRLEYEVLRHEAERLILGEQALTKRTTRTGQ